MKILIVEDDATLRSILGQVLASEGYEIVQAASGNEAQQKLASDSDIGLVISDFMMPNGSGRDLLEFVRKRHPTTPPFIMITGHAEISAGEVRRLGAQDCIYKPFDIDKFLDTVKSFESSRS